MIEIIKNLFIEEKSFLGLAKLTPKKPAIFYGKLNRLILKYNLSFPQKMPVLLISSEEKMNR